MTYDPEHERVERERRRKKYQAEIADVTADLERTLKNPDPDAPTLWRQGDLLDCLLYALMKDSLGNDRRMGRLCHDQITMALRIQKQCAETIKAATAIDYMTSLMNHRTHNHTPRHTTRHMPRHMPDVAVPGAGVQGAALSVYAPLAPPTPPPLSGEQNE